MSNLEPDEELDCRGLSCPLPVLKAKKALGRLAPGTILKVIASDPGSPRDMKKLSVQTGDELIETEEGFGEFVFWFRKS
jgi:tRNA 2-thiouridine synthesizing protein A